MISVSGNKLSERKLNNRIIEKISVDNNLSYDLSKIVLNRGYSLDEINELENEFQLNNPFSNNQFGAFKSKLSREPNSLFTAILKA